MRIGKPIFLFFIFTLFLSACNREEIIVDPPHNPVLDPPTEPSFHPPLDKSRAFLGDYTIRYEQISGIHTFYDSVGRFIKYGFDTVQILDTLMRITPTKHKDTFAINGLIKSWLYHNGHIKYQEVKAVLTNNVMNIIYEKNRLIQNNYIRGEIRFEGDSIFLNYKWDTSDTWSTGALPVSGRVKGKGVRIK